MVGKVVKAEVIMLGKKLRDLIAELENRGFSISPQNLSHLLSGKRHNEKIENAIYDILDEWKGKK